MVIWLDINKSEDKAIVEIIQEKLRKTPLSFTAVHNTYYAHSRDILQDVYQDMLNYVQHGMDSKNPKFIMSIHDTKQEINDSRFDDIGDVVIVYKHHFDARFVGIIDHSHAKQNLQEICNWAINSLNGKPLSATIDSGVVNVKLSHNHYCYDEQTQYTKD